MSCCSDKLVEWLIRRRWYPSKGTLPDEMATFRLSRNVLGVVLRVKSQEIFTPVLVSGEEFTEGEHSVEYVKSLIEGGTPLNTEAVKPIPRGRIRVKPLSSRWTNVLSIVEVGGSKYVLKGYRTVSADLSEPRFLRYLTKAGFPHTPELVMEVKLGNVTIAVMTKYIESVSDGGLPFYVSASRHYRSSELDNVLENAVKLGNVVASFHNVMSACREEWCQPKIATEEDVKTWLNDIELQTNMNKKLLRDLSSEVGVDVCEVVNKALTKLKQELKDLKGLKLIRTHGDLHLAQTLYTGRDFILIDFEGEPNRTQERRDVLETASRDLACIARSLHYIALTSLTEAKGVTAKESLNFSVSGVTELERVSQWQEAVLNSFLNGYLTRVNLEDVQGSPDIELFMKTLNTWTLERALYELNYELNYGTGYTYIPLKYLLTVV